MKLTIITGPQGSGKTSKLSDLCRNKAIRYDNTRLDSYPICLPQFTGDIETIAFKDVNDLAHLHRLAALMSEEVLKYKLQSPGTIYERIHIDIVISTQVDKKRLSQLFRGVPGICYRDLKPLSERLTRHKKQITETV